MSSIKKPQGRAKSPMPDSPEMLLYRDKILHTTLKLEALQAKRIKLICNGMYESPAMARLMLDIHTLSTCLAGLKKELWKCTTERLNKTELI